MATGPGILESRVDVNVLKLQNLCSTLKIDIYGIERNPKTQASNWLFIFREPFCCGRFVNPRSSHCRGLKTVWWICKTLKRIQRSFSNHRCHRPYQMNHILCNSYRNFQCNHQGITLKIPLILTLTKPFTDPNMMPYENWEFWLFWEHPWTYVKALAAKKLCGIFLMQLSRLCEELTLLAMRYYELVCGKREHSFST